MPSPFYTPGADIFGGAVAARRDAQNDFASRLGQLYAGGDQKAGQTLGGIAPDKLDAIRSALEKMPATEQAKAKQRVDMLKKWVYTISQTQDEPTRALLWNQMIAQAYQSGADVSNISPNYSEAALREAQTGIMSLDEIMSSAAKGQSANNLMKTYTDSDGNEVGVYRDGSTKVLGKASQSLRYTPEGLVFDPRQGTLQEPGAPQTAPQPGEPMQPAAADPMALIAEARAREDARKLRLATETAAATTRAETTAKADADRAATDAARERQTEQTLADLDQMDALAKKGVYTGGLLDTAGNFLASKGFAVDQGKANRTSQIMQLATMLKFGVKPPGMGAMSDAEWKIIQDAIPDPRSVGSESQLTAGIQEALRRLKEWQARQTGKGAPAAQGKTRIKIDASGNIVK